MLVIWLLVLVLGVAYLAHRRTPPWTALGVTAGYLLLMGIFSHAPVWLMAVFWLVLLAVALPLALPEQRRSLFSAPLFAWFKRVLPPMSATERDAIEAGTVWWDGELFSGKPDWDKLGYCWTHGFKVMLGHNSSTCQSRRHGHQPGATRSNRMGGSRVNDGFPGPLLATASSGAPT